MYDVRVESVLSQFMSMTNGMLIPAIKIRTRSSDLKMRVQFTDVLSVVVTVFEYGQLSD